MPDLAPAPARAALAAPTPTAPADGAVAPLDAVTFRWSAPPGADAFDLRVAAADAPDAPLVELAALPTTETTLADALSAGDLVWWVRQSGGAWSAPARFRAGTPADVEAALRAEAEAAARQRTAEREARRSGAEPLPEAPPDPEWPYAEGESLDGTEPDWARVPGFGAPARPDRPRAEAAPPLPVGPLGGEVVDAVAVSLRWTAVPGADGYEVELSPDPAFGRDVLALDAGAATELALPALVPPTGWKLLWRVRARLGDAATAWSPYGRFYPADVDATDRFRAGLDRALVAQRRQRDHARLVRQRELDLVPPYQRPDAFTSAATAATILAMALSSAVIVLAAVIAALVWF